MKLSIIIPVFNDELYIERCLNSIIVQKFKDFECILIDDGSKDQSLNIIKKLAENDSRIKYFHIENSGVSYARNLGLEKSCGEYITFIDGDDYIEGDYFNQVFSDDYLLYDIFCCGIQRVNFVGKKLHIEFKESNIEKMFINYPAYMYSVCNKVFKRSLLVGESFNVGITVCEDMIFSFKAFSKANKIKYLDNDYYCYFKNDNSASYKITTDKTLSEYKSVYREIEMYCDKNDIVELYDDFIKYRKLYYYIFYLTDINHYNPNKYREENTEKLVWRYNKRLDLRFISKFANVGFDLPSRLYVFLKKLKTNK